VDSAISNPSLSSSPWMRGAPHNGFSLLIRWMSSRSSRLTLGLPADREISIANKPEILLDATERSCQAERCGTNRAGSATFWSSKPSGHGHLPEAGPVMGCIRAMLS
jgi:hypothetical protein